MDISDQIKKIISKTKEDKINWSVLNPQAFRWIIEKNNTRFTTTFQTVNIAPNATITSNNPASIGNGTFVFTLQKTNPNETIIQVQVNRTTNTEYIDLLNDLYRLIKEKTKKDYSKILDDLLDNL